MIYQWNEDKDILYICNEDDRKLGELYVDPLNFVPTDSHAFTLNDVAIIKDGFHYVGGDL